MGAEPVVDIFVAGTMENRQIVPPSSLPAIGAEALAAKAMNETKQFATVRGRPAFQLVLAMESAERPIWVTRLAHICKADRRRWLA